MKIWVDSRLEEAVRSQIIEERRRTGPQLCCEARGIDPARAVKLLIWTIRAWEREIVFGSFHVDGRSGSCLFDMLELETVLHEAVESEEVVAITDVATLGGCVIDFSADGERTVEVLVTAWGKHEGMARDLAEKLGNAQLFRGN